MKKKRPEKKDLSFNKSRIEKVFSLLSFVLVIFLVSGFIYPGFLKTRGASISFTQDSWDGGTIGGDSVVEVGNVPSWDKFLSSSSLDLDTDGRLKLAEEIRKWNGIGHNISNSPGVADTNPAIYPDSVDGSYFVVWESGGNDIRVQKIDENGDPVWAPGGISIVPGGTYAGSFDADSDGAGGIIIAWGDNRDLGFGFGSDKDIYVKRIDLNGNPWVGGDRIVSISLDLQVKPQVVSDGLGGAIVSWKDSADMTVRVQRIYDTCDLGDTFNGYPEPGKYMCWDSLTDGNSNYRGFEITMSGFTSDDDVVSMVSDNVGGAIISWVDLNSALHAPGDPYIYNVYAQRVNDSLCLSGLDMRCWNAGARGKSGIKVTSLTDNQISPRITTDGASGVIVFWESENRIYVQKMNDACGAGNSYRCWGVDGILVSSRIPYLPKDTFRVMDDALGGAGIIWEVDNGTDKDLYAQRVSVSCMAGGYICWENGESSGDWNGLAISIANGDQENAAINNNGNGSFYFAWSDKRTNKKLSGLPTIFAQNVSTTGALGYKKDGTELNFERMSGEISPYLSYVGDAGNVSAVYTDNSGVAQEDIYIQKIGEKDNLNNGTVISSIFDFGEIVNWAPLDWDAILPDLSSSIDFEIRTAQSDPTIGGWSTGWVSVGEVNSDSNPSEDLDMSSIEPGRYIQYKLTFTKGTTPTLSSITLSGILTSSVPPPTYTPLEERGEMGESLAEETAETVTTPQVCANTLVEIQTTPLPYFNPIWGKTYHPWDDSVKWAYDHRANIYYEYVGLLNREPCATEVNWWLQNDPDIFSIRYKILTSEEYLNKYK